MAGFPDDPRALLYQSRFTDGNANAGIPASNILAAWANSQTNELKNVLDVAGVSEDFSDSKQLIKSLLAMFHGGPWQPDVTYKTGAVVRASDGFLYELYGLQDSLNQNPITAANRPAIWLRYDANLPGTILPWPVPQAPEGYLYLWGGSVPKTQFRRLYAVVGDYYGSTANDFVLPDYRGRYLRGYSPSGVRDPDAALRRRDNGQAGNTVGGALENELKAHDHDSNTTPARDNWRQGDVVFNSIPSSGGAKTGSFGGNETRGNDITANWIIKY